MDVVLLLFLFWDMDVHLCTDSHMTMKNFEIDGLPRYGDYQWCSAFVPSAGSITAINGVLCQAL